MKRKVMLLVMVAVLLAGCGKKEKPVEQESPVSTEEVTGEESSEVPTEVGNQTNSAEESSEPVLDPDDFRLDSEDRTPEETMQDILNKNKGYIESKGLSLDTLLTAEWEYRESDDLYSIIAYDGTNFHAVILSVTDGTMVIDPQ